MVPRLRRSVIVGIDNPALPGWAYVWRPALRAFSSHADSKALVSPAHCGTAEQVAEKLMLCIRARL